MLSYQHSYHAGNLADVHKHAVLSCILDYLSQKDKPLSYIETHAGRGLYDLSSTEAIKTGEAGAGILKITKLNWFAEDHPYMRALMSIKECFGECAYPGSPLIADYFLRNTDVMHLAELHPKEYQALADLLGKRAHLYMEDGFKLARRVCPPTPRRGLMMIDPSYELEEDYHVIPPWLEGVLAKWNVGVVCLWYPILHDGRHRSMVDALKVRVPDGLHHQVLFPPAREGHRMIGSGLFIVRAPYGLHAELTRLEACYTSLISQASGRCDPDGNPSSNT